MIPRVRLTGFGAVAIALLVACGVIVVVAAGAVQVAALLVGCLLLLALAGEGLGSGSGGDDVRKAEVLRRQARPRRIRRAPDAEEIDPASGLVERRVRDPE